jgi:hypothetical protein
MDNQLQKGEIYKTQVDRYTELISLYDVIYGISYRG